MSIITIHFQFKKKFSAPFGGRNLELKSLVENNLKSMSECSPERCGICKNYLGLGKSISSLSHCNHTFCSNCINQWAKIKNVCPLCKSKFTSTNDGINAKKWDNNSFSNESCMICDDLNNESLMLICDGCDNYYHTYCIGLSQIPVTNTWYCQQCTTSHRRFDNSDDDDAHRIIMSTSKFNDSNNIPKSKTNSKSNNDTASKNKSKKKSNNGNDWECSNCHFLNDINSYNCQKCRKLKFLL